MIERTARNFSRALGAFISILVLSAPVAEASNREATVTALEDLESAWPSTDVSIEVVHESGGDGPVRIGDGLVYRFSSRRSGYLTALHIDTHGSTTLLFPRAEGPAVIGPQLAVDLPSAEDGFSLQVQPPIGRDLVYAIVTEQPITRADLGVQSGDIVLGIEPQDSARFIRRIRTALDSRTGGKIAVAHVAQQVDGRGEVLYRSADIVQFFGERTRSIKTPKLDLQIQFATNSASLDPTARRNVDEFARALGDPKLADTRFVIAGHTDDRGSDQHNLQLSRRRAEAVRSYLIQQGGVRADRLSIEAHGENYPLMGEDSEFARSMNRRVEFSPAR